MTSRRPPSDWPATRTVRRSFTRGRWTSSPAPRSCSRRRTSSESAPSSTGAPSTPSRGSTRPRRGVAADSTGQPSAGGRLAAREHGSDAGDRHARGAPRRSRRDRAPRRRIVPTTATREIAERSVEHVTEARGVGDHQRRDQVRRPGTVAPECRAPDQPTERGADDRDGLGREAMSASSSSSARSAAFEYGSERQAVDQACGRRDRFRSSIADGQCERLGWKLLPIKLGRPQCRWSQTPAWTKEQAGASGAARASAPIPSRRLSGGGGPGGRVRDLVPSSNQARGSGGDRGCLGARPGAPRRARDAGAGCRAAGR